MHGLEGCGSDPLRAVEFLGYEGRHALAGAEDEFVFRL